MVALFIDIGAFVVLIYLLVFVLLVMFLYRGFVYFGRKLEADERLLEKLDRLMEVIEKDKHNY